MRHQPGIRILRGGTWWEVWPQYPRLRWSPSLPVAQQRFLGAHRSTEASRLRTEMQRGSGVPGAGWETGILHPLQT